MDWSVINKQKTPKYSLRCTIVIILVLFNNASTQLNQYFKYFPFLQTFPLHTILFFSPLISPP